MAADDEAGNEKPPGSVPPSLDDADRLAEQFTPMWEAGAATTEAKPSPTAVPSPGGNAAAPEPRPAPALKGTMIGLAPVHPPPAAPAAAPIIPPPPAEPPTAPSAPVLSPMKPSPSAPPKPPAPLGRTMVGLAPPHGIFAPPPEPRPEAAAPDHKAEYVPPMALRQSLRAEGAGTGEASVDVGSAAVVPRAPVPQASESSRGASGSSAMPADEADDLRANARVDTVPPKSRRQQESRKIVIWVMSVAVVLIIAMVIRKFGFPKEDIVAPSSPASEPVVAPPQPVTPPAETSAPVVAAPEAVTPPPVPAAPAEPAASVAPPATPVTEQAAEGKPPAAPAASAQHPTHVPRHTPQVATAHPSHPASHPTPRPAPQPASAGAIVRDTPF